MTASEAIATARDMRQGTVSYSQYLKWINVIEGRIQTEIMGKRAEDIIKYGQEGDNKELLVPHPYDEVYIYYLCAMTDFHNEELELYAADAQFFEQKFEDFKKYYGRNTSSGTVQIHGWWNS